MSNETPVNAIKISAPGIYDGITNHAYHAHPALGSTSLKTLATRTPAHYQWDRTHPKHSDAFTLGTAVHSMVLEDNELEIVVVKADNWLSKAAKEEKAEALAAGKQPLLSKEWRQVCDMHYAIHDHPVASKLLTGHKAEQSVFWNEGAQMFKCRPDAWKPGHLVDLKTTINADPNEFGKTAHNFGYHQSAAHYIDGVKAVTGETLPFVFILVEKTAPYFVSVVELDDVAIDYGRQLNERAKQIHAECSRTNTWPGYHATEPIGLPEWAYYQTDELLGLNGEMDVAA